eukprot:5297830-Prymnesium_polylepis.3
MQTSPGSRVPTQPAAVRVRFDVPQPMLSLAARGLTHDRSQRTASRVEGLREVTTERVRVRGRRAAVQAGPLEETRGAEGETAQTVARAVRNAAGQHCQSGVLCSGDPRRSASAQRS